MAAGELDPGLMIWHGNQLEDLRDVLAAWLRRQPLAPLENEIILVQSQGMGQWLKLALAGADGVSAAVSMQLPSQFLWRAYRDVLGPDAVPADSPLERRTLVWRLMRLLPALSAGPEFAVLRGFLAGDDDGRKLFQLAGKLAELFDQYQVYRADWLADWQAGRDGLAQADGQWRALTDDDRWQPALWRATTLSWAVISSTRSSRSRTCSSSIFMAGRSSWGKALSMSPMSPAIWVRPVFAPTGMCRPNSRQKPRIALMCCVRAAIHSERVRCIACKACCSTVLTRTGLMSLLRAASSNAAASAASVLLRRT